MGTSGLGPNGDCPVSTVSISLLSSDRYRIRIPSVLCANSRQTRKEICGSFSMVHICSVIAKGDLRMHMLLSVCRTSPSRRCPATMRVDCYYQDSAIQHSVTAVEGSSGLLM